jgi:hypothetical protein
MTSEILAFFPFTIYEWKSMGLSNIPVKEARTFQIQHSPATNPGNHHLLGVPSRNGGKCYGSDQ